MSHVLQLHPARRALQLIILLLGMTAMPAALAEPTRILLFGDHFISGQSGFVGFRYDLYFMLVDQGYEIDFVGSQTVAGQGHTPADYPRYAAEFDPDHEGYVEEYAGDIMPMLSPALTSYDPDMVIISMGWWDIRFSGAQGITDTIGWMDFAIGVIRNHNPNAVIVLGHLHPITFGGAGLVPDLNAEMDALAALRTTAESPVVSVDTSIGFDIDSMIVFEIGYVANRLGESVVADNYRQVLETLLPEPNGGSNFQINAGINDAWWNPATPGQGFFFNVFPDLGLMFIAWFTFDTERPAVQAEQAGLEQARAAVLGEDGHRWVTGIGPYNGDTANIVLELTEGGVFNSADPPVTQTQGYGSLDLTFADCSNATATFSIPAASVSGTLNLQRIVGDNVPLCESLAGGQARR